MKARDNSEWCFPPSLLFHTRMTSTPFVKLLIIVKRNKREME